MIIFPDKCTFCGSEIIKVSDVLTKCGNKLKCYFEIQSYHNNDFIAYYVSSNLIFGKTQIRLYVFNSKDRQTIFEKQIDLDFRLEDFVSFVKEYEDLQIFE
jgi:hypothetical protein